MSLTVHTARVSYGGADRLDVSRKSAGPDGIAFAPSWAILRPALDLLSVARSMRAAADHAGAAKPDDAMLAESCVEMTRAAEAIEIGAWALYVEAYRGEMRESYRTHRPAWDALLARSEVTLVCYCTDAARCHRTLLAGILAKLGATIAGERGGR
jgi:hypothetical protein